MCQSHSCPLVREAYQMKPWNSSSLVLLKMSPLFAETTLWYELKLGESVEAGRDRNISDEALNSNADMPTDDWNGKNLPLIRCTEISFPFLMWYIKILNSAEISTEPAEIYGVGNTMDFCVLLGIPETGESSATIFYCNKRGSVCGNEVQVIVLFHRSANAKISQCHFLSTLPVEADVTLI